MKLQNLTIHNIASIEDAVIDFEKDPLGNSEVFLITGKTGAGKSTILDSICLALYGTTPRLYNTEMQGEVRDGEQYVRISHPSQLLRRNTGEGFVELFFKGNNDNYYVARWSIARARKKPTGNLKTREWLLINLTNGESFAREYEIKEEITKALGLDFTQFCRTTMLAQGDFSKFLNSEDTQKSEILEKITGTAIYSRIGAKIYEITSQKQRDWNALLDKLNGIEVLSEEQINLLNEEIQQIENQYDQVKNEADVDLTKKDWIQKEEEFSHNLSLLSKELQLVERTIASDAYKLQEKEVSDWKKSFDARNLINSKHKNEGEIKKLGEELEILRDEFIIIVKGLNKENEKRHLLAESLKEIEIYFDSVKGSINTLENADSIIVFLKNIAEGKKKIDKENKIIAEYLQRKSYLEISLKTKSDEVEKLSHELIDIENKKKKKEAELEEAGLQKLNEENLKNEQDVNRINLLKEKLKAYNEKTEALKVSLIKLETDLNTVKEKKEESGKQKILLEEAKEKETKAKEIYESQKDTIDKFAKAMRSKLKVGDCCPVCRQRIESIFVNEEDLTDLIEGYRKEYVSMEEKRKQLELGMKLLAAEINIINSSVDRKNEDIKKFKQDLKILEDEISLDCKELELEYDLEGLEKNIDKLLNDKEEKKLEIASLIEVALILSEQVRQLQSNYNIKNGELNQAKEEKNKQSNSISDANTKIEVSKGIINQESENIEYAENNIRQLTGNDWKEIYGENPLNAANKINEATNLYKNLKEKKTNLELAFKDAETLIFNVEEVLENLREMKEEWKTFNISDSIEVKNLRQKGLSLKEVVSTKLVMLEHLHQDNEEIVSQLCDFIHKNEEFGMERLLLLNAKSPEEIEKMSEQLEIIRNNFLTSKTKFVEEEKRYILHASQKPEMDEDLDTKENLEARLKELEINLRKLGEEKGMLQQKLIADKEVKKRIEEMLKELESKKADYDKWSRLNNLIGDAKGSKFRKIAQSYVLENLVFSANHYMTTLSGRYRLKTSPNSFVISVEDAYQGFVTRSAATLSGGETFLVSLSLALALSDIGESLGVDILFIDEGFGTLSGEPLQKAIATLRSLHSKTGKQVGIISHVEELQEKIPVQIRVEQSAQNSGSEIRIVP